MKHKRYKGINGLAEATIKKWRARHRKEEARLGRRLTNDELLNILLTPKRVPVRSLEGV